MRSVNIRMLFFRHPYVSPAIGFISCHLMKKNVLVGVAKMFRLDNKGKKTVIRGLSQRIR